MQCHMSLWNRDTRPFELYHFQPYDIREKANALQAAMDGKRRIARHQQYAALYFGAQLEADKREYFLGSAKVDIDSLSFDPFFSRDIHHQNSERLLSSYELTGCLQFESSHHIPAVIDENDLAEALSRAGSTYDMAQGRDHTQWPMLSFTAQSQVECLRGKHRIDAARAYLRPGLRWWVVDFYSKSK